MNNNLLNTYFKVNSAEHRQMLEFIITKGVQRSYKEGVMIVREGQQARSVYIIIKGKVDVLKNKSGGKETVVATLHEGAIIGEMGVFLEQKRSASIRTKTEVRLSEISNTSFVNAVMTIPGLYKRLMHSFVQKIVETNKSLEKINKEKMIMILLYTLKDIYTRTNEPQNGLIIRLQTIAKSLNTSLTILLSLFQEISNLNLISDFRNIGDGKVFFNMDPDDFIMYIQSIV
jgi:CRP/FNR family cyclic AMP-dependent transcriptional regulator